MLLGRARELELLTQVLADDRRMIVVFGPPGIGKSSLLGHWEASLEVASCHVELHASQPNPAAALASALGLHRETDDPYAQVHEAIADLGDLVVIADGRLSHEDVPSWQRLCQENPTLRVVLASRALPSSYEGASIALAPLAPEIASELYLRRVADYGIAVSAQEAEPLVAALEGLPLAIDLAARVTMVMTPAQLVERLRTDLAPLDVQGALTAAAQAIWEEVDPSLRELALQLSWQVGPFSLEMAEHYCTWQAQPMWQGIAELLRQAILTTAAPQGGRRRYRMLAPMRTSLHRAVEAEVFEAERLRLGRCVARRAYALWEADCGVNDGSYLAELHAELPLLRALTEVLRAGDPGFSELTLLLGQCVYHRVVIWPGFEKAATAALEGELEPGLRLDLALRYVVCYARHDLDQISSIVEDAEAGELWAQASQARRFRASLHAHNHHDDDALRDFREALVLARRSGKPGALVNALQNLGWFLSVLDHFEEAMSVAREALKICSDRGDTQRESRLLRQLAWACLHAGFLDEAEHHMQRAEELSGLRPLLAVVREEFRLSMMLARGERERFFDELGPALERFEALDLVHSFAGWSGNASGVFALAGRFEEGRAHLLRALDCYQRASLSTPEAMTFLMLVAAHLLLEDVTAARGYMARAQATGVEFDKPDYVVLMTLLGHILEDRALAVDRESTSKGQMLLSALQDDDLTFARAISEVETWLAIRANHTALSWCVALCRWWRGQRDQSARQGVLVEVATGLVWMPGHSQPVDLSRRGPMWRVLVALVESQHGATLSLWDAFEAGWPGESADVEHMAHRVRVVISRLRKLGLKPHILTREQGYQWSPHAQAREMD